VLLPQDEDNPDLYAECAVDFGSEAISARGDIFFDMATFNELEKKLHA
jgi:hypothetical protein